MYKKPWEILAEKLKSAGKKPPTLATDGMGCSDKATVTIVPKPEVLDETKEG